MSAEPTRERILECVAPVFAEEGFEGATTRALARAAGVNVATIAYHFRDKQGLYDALVDRAYQRVLEIDVALPAGGDREARLRAMVRTVYAFAVQHRVLVRVLLRHVLETRRLPPVARLRWMEPIVARLGYVFAQIDIPLDPPRLLAVQSLQHLVVRYAITEPEDLVVPGDDPHAVVGEHLADVACRVLLD